MHEINQEIFLIDIVSIMALTQRIRKTGEHVFLKIYFARLYISPNKYQIIDYKKESYLVSEPTFLSSTTTLFVERKN